MVNARLVTFQVLHNHVDITDHDSLGIYCVLVQLAGRIKLSRNWSQLCLNSTSAMSVWQTFTQECSQVLSRGDRQLSAMQSSVLISDTLVVFLFAMR